MVVGQLVVKALAIDYLVMLLSHCPSNQRMLATGPGVLPAVQRLCVDEASLLEQSYRLAAAVGSYSVTPADVATLLDSAELLAGMAAVGDTGHQATMLLQMLAQLAMQQLPHSYFNCDLLCSLPPPEPLKEHLQPKTGCATPCNALSLSCWLQVYDLLLAAC